MEMRPATLATLTTALGAERRSSGSSASVSRTWAPKLSAMVASTPAEPALSKAPVPEAPALLTSRSRRPCSRSTRSATVAGASASVRSTAITVAPPSSSASACSRSRRRATSTRRAVAAPMPLDAPVTSAIISSPSSSASTSDRAGRLAPCSAHGVRWGRADGDVGVYRWVWQGSAMRRPPPGLRPVRYAYAPPSVERLLGALPVVAGLCRRLDLAGIVDRACPVREVARVTHGQVVEALVANRLSSPRPLLRVQDWAAEWAVEEVFRIPPDALNDDRIGRALDAIAPELDQVVGSVRARAITAFGIDVARLHWDMTSVSLYGAYDEVQAGFAQPRWGKPKDRRPDLKQVQAGLAVSGDGGVPG